MIRTATTLLMFAAAMPAVAQTAAEPKAKPPADKKICRMTETTGSIMGGTRTCHTKAEWASIDQANGDRVSASRDLNSQGGNRQGGGGFN